MPVPSKNVAPPGGVKAVAHANPLRSAEGTPCRVRTPSNIL